MSALTAYLRFSGICLLHVFLLGAGYGFLKNSHVRIDFISSKLATEHRNWIDVIGILLVLFPFCCHHYFAQSGLFLCKHLTAVKCRKMQAA